MNISIDIALPCAQYIENSSPAQRCGELTHGSMIVPDIDGTWEMIPVCPQHLHEARQTFIGPELSARGSTTSSRSNGSGIVSALCM